MKDWCLILVVKCVEEKDKILVCILVLIFVMRGPVLPAVLLFKSPVLVEGRLKD
jgi:hypothetical protein